MTGKQNERGEIITVAMTGASGAAYGFRLMEVLAERGSRIFVLISDTARVVLAAELGVRLPQRPSEVGSFLSKRFCAGPGQLRVFGNDEWSAPVASGSGAPGRMVICPCSTGTLSAIACGSSDSLLERAADVVLKERGQLIVVPREMPFSEIHLENMLRLARMGVTVLPACPSFYNKPSVIADVLDSVVARILDHLGIGHHLQSRWGCDD